MGKPYQVKNEGGSPSGNWFFFSERAGDVIDAGPDKEIAETMADDDIGTETIATVLEGKEDAVQQATIVSDVSKAKDSGSGLPLARVETNGSANSSDTKKRPAISPQFLHKIKEKAASGTASVTIELERFLIGLTGFSTEDLDEDDPDVELLILGWELQWEYWLAGKEPPAWALILFGQVCVTVRLIASAKQKEKDGADKDKSKPVPIPNS